MNVNAKKNRGAAVLFALLLAGCGGGGGNTGGNEGGDSVLLDTPVVFSAGTSTLASSATITQQGGEIRIDDASSSLNGFTFTLPQALLEGSQTVAISSSDGTLTPNSGTFTGQTFVIDTGSDDDFKLPVVVEIPIRTGLGAPLLYLVTGDGTLEFARPGNIDTTNNTRSFYLNRPGTYTVITLASGSGTSLSVKSAATAQRVGTRFVPATDGFQIDNQDSTINRGGECFGMTAFARWYLLNWKAVAGEGLYPRYMCQVNEQVAGEPGINTLYGQNLIATRSFISVSPHWDAFAAEQTYGNLSAASFEAIFAALANTQKPVFLYLSGEDETKNNEPAAHSVLAIAADSATGVIDIYDPNHHGEVKQIRYDGQPGNRTYVPYSIYEDIGFTGDSLPLTESFESIRNDAEGHFGASGYSATDRCPPYAGTTLANVRVLSHSSGDSVNQRIVTLSGDVDSNQVLAERISVQVDSQRYGPVQLQTGGLGFDLFTLPVVLHQGVNRLHFITEGRDASGKYIKVLNNQDMAEDFILESTAAAAIANVTLTWDKAADMDLVVVAPDGDYSDFSHPQMVGGATLNREDENVGPENWTLNSGDQAIYGQPYKIRAHYYYSTEAEVPAVILTTTLRLYEGKANEQMVTYTKTLGTADPTNDQHNATGPDWVDVAEFTLVPDVTEPDDPITRPNESVCPSSLVVEERNTGITHTLNYDSLTHVQGGYISLCNYEGQGLGGSADFHMYLLYSPNAGTTAYGCSHASVSGDAYYDFSVDITMAWSVLRTVAVQWFKGTDSAINDFVTLQNNEAVLVDSVNKLAATGLGATCPAP